ncbi:Clathrin light chain A, partial [Trichoplax sp. H2]
SRTQNLAMADLITTDEFNPAPSDDTQADPAAEFLAREEGELAELGNPETNLLNGSAEVTSTIETGPSDSPKTVDPYADVAEADVIAAEPESIRKWREEYAKRIEEKDESARTEQQEWKDKAKEEVEEWYSRQNDQNDKIKKSNREAEEAFVNERDSIVPGHEWEKVANLCDFTSKSYKCTKDTSRMRSIILQLKQSPLKRESKALCASAE